MIAVRAGQTVTVKRDLGKDDAGDPIAAAPPHTIDNCVFWWSSVSENTDRRQTSIVTGSLALPRGSDIKSTDRVEMANGSKWTVVGPPQWDQDHPLSGRDFGYMIVEMRSVT